MIEKTFREIMEEADLRELQESKLAEAVNQDDTGDNHPVIDSNGGNGNLPVPRTENAVQPFMDSGKEMNDLIEFRPKSEEELIAHARDVHSRVQKSSIAGYWEIGRSINAFYKGTYGTSELKRIAEAIGIGMDTLHKICKFARVCSAEQLGILLQGNCQIPWYQIANNLTVEPVKMIEVYKVSNTVEEFHNGIMILKGSSEKKGKSRAKPVNNERARKPTA